MARKSSKQIKTKVTPPLPIKLTLPEDFDKKIKLSDINCVCKKKKKSVKFNLSEKKGGKKKRYTKKSKRSKKMDKK